VQLLELCLRGPQLSVPPQREREAKPGERSVGIEVEVATEQSTLDRWHQLTIVAIELIAELALLVVEDRDLAEQREDQALDSGRVRQASAVLLDEDHIGTLGEGIRREDEEIATTLTDHAVALDDPPFAQRQRGRSLLLVDRRDLYFRTGEIEAVPTLPEQLRLEGELRPVELSPRRRRANTMQPVVGVLETILNSVEHRLDRSAGAELEAWSVDRGVVVHGRGGVSRRERAESKGTCGRDPPVVAGVSESRPRRAQPTLWPVAACS